MYYIIIFVPYTQIDFHGPGVIYKIYIVSTMTTRCQYLPILFRVNLLYLPKVEVV